MKFLRAVAQAVITIFVILVFIALFVGGQAEFEECQSKGGTMVPVGSHLQCIGKK